MDKKGLIRAEDKAKTATLNDDMFNLSCYTDKLTMLVKNTSNPYVIALSAEWGNGKTFFLNAWRNSILPEAQKIIIPKNLCEKIKNKFRNQEKYKLQQGEIPCVYIDAWALEDLDDPLLVISVCIQEQLQKFLYKNKKQLLKSAIKFIRPSIILKLGISLFKDITKRDFNYTESILSDIVVNSVDRITKKKSKNFSDILQQIVEDVKNKTDTNSILIMIDELDRCTPNYIVKLLERIKHLFNIPGLVFVLAVDNQILRSAIRNEFGFDDKEFEEKYLHKFIDYFYRLPEPDYVQYICELINKECKADGGLSLLNHTNQYIKEIEQEFLKVDEDDIFNLHNKSILSVRYSKSGTYNYLERHFLEWSFFQQCLCYIAVTGITKNNKRGEYKKHSLRSIEKLISKFITLCKCNEFNLVEVLYLMQFIVRNYLDEPLQEKDSIKNLCLFELIHLFLSEASVKNFELSYTINQKFVYPNQMVLDKSIHNRLDLLSKIFQKSTLGMIEEKIKKALNFYNLTEQREETEENKIVENE